MRQTRALPGQVGVDHLQELMDAVVSGDDARSHASAESRCHSPAPDLTPK
jgi:hypothetical protein